MICMKLVEFEYENTVHTESKPLQLSCEHLSSNILISCHSLGHPNSYFMNVYKQNRVDIYIAFRLEMPSGCVQ
jgi:hypothetical protein